VQVVFRGKELETAGTSYDLLKDVITVSQEAQRVFNTIHAPYLPIPEMNVAMKNQ
jgi:hypothetical protein